MAGLVLAGTPIGDVRDAPAALGRALAAADIIAAEDTRRARTLFRRLGVAPAGEVVSYFEGNEAARTPGLVEAALAGKTVVLITDAGMPAVSDPGYRLVRAALDAGVPVTAVPGPSAVLTALVLSGLPVDRFCFEGFLPRQAGARRRRLAELAAEPRTMVFFEAPHRVAAMVADAAAAWGPDRAAAICRELTKPYEQIVRGGLGELAEWASGGVRGEVTIVVAGATGSAPRPDAMAAAVAEVVRRRAEGERLGDAVAFVAARDGLRRSTLYQAVVAPRDAKEER